MQLSSNAQPTPMPSWLKCLLLQSHNTLGKSFPGAWPLFDYCLYVFRQNSWVGIADTTCHLGISSKQLFSSCQHDASDSVLSFLFLPQALLLKIWRMFWKTHDKRQSQWMKAFPFLSFSPTSHALCLFRWSERHSIQNTVKRNWHISSAKTDRNLQSQAQIIYNSKLDKTHNINDFLFPVSLPFPLSPDPTIPDIQASDQYSTQVIVSGSVLGGTPNWDKYLFIHLFIFCDSNCFIPLYFEIIPSLQKSCTKRIAEYCLQ